MAMEDALGEEASERRADRSFAYSGRGNRPRSIRGLSRKLPRPDAEAGADDDGGQPLGPQGVPGSRSRRVLLRANVPVKPVLAAQGS